MAGQKIVQFQEDNFEQKLLALKDTQDSIQSLSAWCLKYQQQHKKVVNCWLHVFRKVKVEQRVTLFYLANDVIQYSKRKNYPFVESWAPALQKATPFVRDDKIRHKILRLFKIWNQRNVYDEAFLSDLCGLLTAKTKKSSVSTADLVQDFQANELFSKIRKCKVLEGDTDLKFKLYKEANLPAGEELKNLVESVFKDRRSGHSLLATIEDGVDKLENYSEALDLEIKERSDVINALEVGEQFYEHQRGEAKVVCNAYRNFGQRIKNLKKKLEALIPTLGSPLPSPDINAPSPSSGSDLDMPDDSGTVQYGSEQSFIGSDFSSSIHDDKNVAYDPCSFNNYSAQLDSSSLFNSSFNSSAYDSYMINDTNMTVSGYNEGNPIEVINSSQNDSLIFNGDNISNFVQNLVSNVPPPVTVNVPQMSKLPGLGSPPNGTHDLFSKDNVASSLWSDKPPTKYPSWPSSDSSWSAGEKTSPQFQSDNYGGSIDYGDQSRFLSELHDNHTREMNNRMNAVNKFEGVSSIPLPERETEDRHSNLIPLTNSLAANHTWKKTDSDYRTIPMPPTPPIFPSDNGGRSSKTPTDIIESVDMEMSDEDDVKHDEKSRSRRSSFKDGDNEGEVKTDHQPQLMPPPNPWDMMNACNIDVGDNNNQSESQRGDGFPFDLMNSIDGPRMPVTDFTHFPSSVRPGVPSSPGNMGAMNFGQPPIMNMPPPPPPPQGAMFPPRPNFPRQSAPNFNHPYGFFPYGDSNASHPPMFPPVGTQSVSNRNNRNVRAYSGGDMQPRFQIINSVSYQQNPAFPNSGDEDGSVKTIEPLIKNRQSFDSFKSNSNSNASSGDALVSSSARTNLKEICLSSVLEQSMLENDKTDDHEDEYSGISGMGTEELFDDATNENTGDDVDDIYNNIEETAFGDDDKLDDSFDKQSLDSSVESKKQRTPFQATVPKAARLPIAPSNIYEDDERNPCPILPVIDLSDDKNSPNSQFEYNTQENIQDFQNSSFPRRGGHNVYSRESQHFSSPVGNQRFTGPRRGGRFQSPRSDFRPRGPSGFSPFAVDQNRPARSPFNRPPNDVNAMGNFQNSPRMFSGRPQRSFRRGW